MTPAAQLLHLLGAGRHDHAVGARRGARGGCALDALDLDEAEPARAERLERVGRAQLRDCRRPASDAARMTDVPAGTITPMPSTVTCAVASPRTGGVPRSGVSRAGSSMSVMAGPLPWWAPGGPKSSGKCSSALRTGIGVSPPIAHSDPFVIVVQRSSSSTSWVRRTPSSVGGPDAVDDLHPARRPDPARRALAARLLDAELHREARHHARRPSCRPTRRRRRVRPSRRHPRTPRSPSAGRSASGGQVRAERSAHLHRLHRPPGCRAAAEPVDELAQRDPEVGLDDAAAGDVPGELEHLGAAGAAGAQRGVRLAAVGEDHRHRSQREHVVDDRRPPEQPLERGDRRLGAHLARAGPRATRASRSPRRRCRRRRPPARRGRTVARCRAPTRRAPRARRRCRSPGAGCGRRAGTRCAGRRTPRSRPRRAPRSPCPRRG